MTGPKNTVALAEYTLGIAMPLNSVCAAFIPVVFKEIDKRRLNILLGENTEYTILFVV